MSRSWRAVFCAAVFSAAICGSSESLYGQDSRATLLGQVTDPSSAVLANVEVEAVNVATGVKVKATTNSDGSYRIGYLNPGLYRVTFSTTGFRKVVREDVALRVAQLFTLDVAMELGEMSQQVTVKDTAPPLDSASASLGQVVDHLRLEDTPFREGNPHEFIKLAPGVVTQTHLRLDKPGMTGGLSQVSVDGSDQYRGEFQFDGVANTASNLGGGSGTTVSYSPPAAAVVEMKVATATFDASQGYTLGGVFNLVSRGGTNQYHGEGWIAYRNGRLDAKDFFATRNNQPKPLFYDHRYGVALGGPIKRDKLHFFAATEFNPYQNPFTFGMTVPTALMRTGDLTELNQYGKIFDPLSGRPDPTSPGRIVRDPFPSNVLPASRLDPASLKLIQLYPKQNVAGISQNFQHPNPVEFHHWYTGTARVDYAISDRNRLFGRYSEARWNYHDPYFFLDENLSPGATTDRVVRSGAVDDTFTISPSMVLNTRFGWTFQENWYNPVSAGAKLGDFGLGGLTKLSSTPNSTPLPYIQISGYTCYRCNIGEGLGSDDANKVFTAGATLNYTKSSHMFAFGAEHRYYIQNYFDNFATRAPAYTFGSGWTVGPYNTSSGVNQLNALAGFLLGFPTAGSMGVASPRNERSQVSALYIQDNWRLTPKLTLNLGLRWELEQPTTEAGNRAVTGLDLATSLPIEAAVLANYAKSPIPEVSVTNFHVRGGMLYAGTGGQQTTLWNTRWTNFMPRLGVAYRLNGKTVLRAGFGRFYDSLGLGRGHSVQTGYSQSTNLQTSVDSILPRLDAFSNPFPSGLLQPAGNSLGLMSNVGNAISTTYAPGVHTPYAERFSFGIQRDLPFGFMAEATYVGNRGHELPVTWQMDATPIQYMSPLQVRDQATIDYLAARFPNPFYGILSTGTSLGSSSTTSRSQFLYKYPQYTGVSYIQTNGKSWYDALQVRVERQLAHGVTTSLSYSWAKSLQQTDFRTTSETTPEKRLANNDRTHVLQLNGIWRLPFGRGQKWGGSWNPVVNQILGGWQFSAIYRMESGWPVGFGNFLLNPGTTIADMKLPAGERTWNHEFNTSVFDRVPAHQLGSNIRYYSSQVGTVRTEGFDTFDTILTKNIMLFEKVNLQLRAECYNLLNTANLTGVITDINSASFGSVTSVNGYPRQLEFGLKVKF